MSMSGTLRHYLEDSAIPFEQLAHAQAVTSERAAEAAHVPGSRLAKAVVIESEKRYLAVVVPATRHVDLAAVRDHIGRQCGLAIEQELEGLFPDCQLGSIPALAQAFGIDVLVDRSLLALDEVFCHSGDHALMLRLDGCRFAKLMRNDASVGSFSEEWSA